MREGDYMQEADEVRSESGVRWEELSISNDFLFGKVMQDPELCKELLQRILPDLEIDHVEYPELQKSIRIDIDAKSVRLDVYVKDGKGTVYDIEMQVAGAEELPKRTRYYQSMIDLQMIDRGQSYKKLKPSYIIFICLSDVSGRRGLQDLLKVKGYPNRREPRAESVAGLRSGERIGRCFCKEAQDGG